VAYEDHTALGVGTKAHVDNSTLSMCVKERGLSLEIINQFPGIQRRSSVIRLPAREKVGSVGFSIMTKCGSRKERAT